MSRHDRLIARSALLALILGLLPGMSAGAQNLPPVPPAPDGDDDRAYLLRKQRETFRLNVEADYAAALQKLCQTGYADTPLCMIHQHHEIITPPSLPAAPEGAQIAPHARAARHLPVVQEIIGVEGELAALLMLDDGRRVTVSASHAGRPASILPTGETVLAVEPRRVLIKAPDQAPQSLFLGMGPEGGAP